MRISNDASGQRDSRACIGALLEPHRIEAEDLARVMVIVDELLANVVAHAWEGDDAPHEFDLSLALLGTADGICISLVIEDDGVPFNPTAQRDVEFGQGLEEAKLGGVGLAIVARMSDGFSYCRREGRNQVTVSKLLRKGAT